VAFEQEINGLNIYDASIEAENPTGSGYRLKVGQF